MDQDPKQPKYLSMNKLIEKIDWSNRQICQDVLEIHKSYLSKTKASAHEHQDWPGGLWDHMVQSMNVAVSLYDLLTGMRPLEFSLSDALLVLFWYHVTKLPRSERDKSRNLWIDFPRSLPEALAIRHALDYIDGEGEIKEDSLGWDSRKMWPLGAFTHMCETASSRLWPKFPLLRNDAWRGARRRKNKPPKDMRHDWSWICPICGSDDRSINYQNDAHDGYEACYYCRLCNYGMIV